MENILNKAKKDYLKYLNRAKIDDIYTIKGFISYFFLRNKLPALKDLTLYLFDIIELYLFYYLLGKDLFYIGLLSFVFFKFINIFIKVVSYTLRDKIVYLIKNKKENLISKYFSSSILLYFVILIFLLILFSLLSSYSNRIFFLILFNRIISSFLYYISTIFFQSTYIYRRIFISIFWLIITKCVGLVFIVLSFKFINYLSFICFFYIDGFLQFVLTYYYCRKNLQISGYKLFSKNYKAYFKNIFWLIFDSKINFIIRLFGIFLANSQKLIFILLVYHFYPNYLILFFIVFQLFEFLFISINRISKSLYFDIYKGSLIKNKIIITRLVINNLIIVLIFSLINVFIFDKLSFFSSVYPKWENIFTSLVVFDRWDGLFLFIFFYGVNMFFFRILEYSEAHIINILIQLLSYILLFVLLLVDDNFLLSQNPLSFFYTYGYVNLIIFLILLSFFLSKKWFNFSYLFVNYSKKFLNTKEEFLSEKGYVYLLSLNKYFKNKSHLLIDLINLYLDNYFILKISNSTYAFNFKTKTNKFKLDKIILSNLAFMLDQAILLNDNDIDSIKIKNKHFFPFMFPKLFSFKEVYDLKYSPILNFNLLKDIKINDTKVLYDLKNIYIDENLVFKKLFIFSIPLFDKINFIKFLKLEINNISELKKYYRQTIFNLFSDFIEEINKS